MLLVLLRWNSFATQFYSLLFPAASEPSMNFYNSKLTHFLPFVCVLECRVPISWVSNPTPRSETARLRSNVFNSLTRSEFFLSSGFLQCLAWCRCRIKVHFKGKLRDTKNPFVVFLEFVLKPVKFLSDDARVWYFMNSVGSVSWTSSTRASLRIDLFLELYDFQ